MDLPDDRQYTRHGLWVKETEDGLAVGLARPLAEKARRFGYLELPEPGSTVEEGRTLIEYEAIKSIGDLLSPVAGRVLSVSDEIEARPGRLSEDPMGTVLVTIKPDGPVPELLTAAEAERLYAEKLGS